MQYSSYRPFSKSSYLPSSFPCLLESSRQISLGVRPKVAHPKMFGRFRGKHFQTNIIEWYQTDKIQDTKAETRIPGKWSELVINFLCLFLRFCLNTIPIHDSLSMPPAGHLGVTHVNPILIVDWLCWVRTFPKSKCGRVQAVIGFFACAQFQI